MFNTILYNKDSVSAFNVSLVFVGKIKLLLWKDDQKMYENLQGKI